MIKELHCLSTSFAIELSPEEAATALKVHPRTVRNLITRKVLKAKKVRRKWFIERRSLLDYLSSMNGAAPAVTITKEKNLRQLAPYRLCLHVFETFDWQHPEQTIQAFLETQKITILSEIGAGYYSYGGQKIRHYQRARSAIGATLALLDAYPTAQLQKAAAFMEAECLSSLGSLLRKLDKTKKGSDDEAQSQHAASLYQSLSPAP